MNGNMVKKTTSKTRQAGEHTAASIKHAAGMTGEGMGAMPKKMKGPKKDKVDDRVEKSEGRESAKKTRKIGMMP